MTFVKNNIEGRAASKIRSTSRRLSSLRQGPDKCALTEFSKPGGKANRPAKSKAGSGVTNAVVGPQRAPLNFNVSAYVAGNNLTIFYIEQNGGSVTKALQGKISSASGSTSRSLSSTIPPDLQQPAAGPDAALNDLQTPIYKKKGKNSLSPSTGARRRSACSARS